MGCRNQHLQPRPGIRWNTSPVIEAATWQALGVGGQAFEKHPAVPIRGRRQIEDLYALPLAG